MALVIRNLFKKFGESWIIKDVSLEIKRGEILGIFGVIGVGKSTLLRAIAGDINHTDGAVFFDADDVTDLDCAERPIHFPRVTNNDYWRENFKTERPSELSDGVGQVIALENALSIAKDVLLLDNQFCYMDRETREENCRKLRRTVKEKNLAVVFATNNYAEVFSICDRVAVLDDGEVKQTGTPREVYETPTSAVVARVTGRNNLIEATLVDSDNAEMREFQTVDGAHRIFTDKLRDLNSERMSENYTLAIRPENISLSFGASFPEDNLLRAEIKSVEFQGATTLITLDAGGLKLTAMVLRLVGLQTGEECMVGLPPDRILVFQS